MNVHVGGVPVEKTLLPWVSRARQVVSTGRDTVQLRHRSAAMTNARTAMTAAAMTAMLGLAAACWVLAVQVTGTSIVPLHACHLRTLSPIGAAAGSDLRAPSFPGAEHRRRGRGVLRAIVRHGQPGG